MKALVDGDILRYEVGFAAEAGYRATTGDPEAIPPWEYVEECFHGRLNNILSEAGASEYVLYLTEGETFRDQIATVKPYKGTRTPNKPWHYNNLTTYMTGPLAADVSRGIEADDAMAIEQTKAAGYMDDKPETIICSRDKDLKQVPGWFLSWELGNQPQFGPKVIDKIGSLELSANKKKLDGTGLSFFYAQCLVGDAVDNIPGLPGCGPVAAYDVLKDCNSVSDLEDAVLHAYVDRYGSDAWLHLLEQGRLLWMVRRYNKDGTPQMWEIGMDE